MPTPAAVINAMERANFELDGTDKRMGNGASSIRDRFVKRIQLELSLMELKPFKTSRSAIPRGQYESGLPA